MSHEEEPIQCPVGRGQTEPPAALVAVALFCVALSVYAGFLTGLVPEFSTDRELAEVTGERVWETVNENGIFQEETALRSALDADTLPDGHRVAVTVTYAHEGTVTASQASFDGAGRPVETAELDGETFRRPVPVQRRKGDVRPGMLTVVVSDDG